MARGKKGVVVSPNEASRKFREANRALCIARTIASRKKKLEEYKAKERSRGKIRYAENSEAAKLKTKLWQCNNPEKVKERNARYRQEHPEKFREHRKNNPIKYRAYQAKRRTLKLQTHGQFTDEDVKQLYVLQKGRCTVCKKSIEGGYHIDHIVPLSKGGMNDRDNIQLLCPTCNLTKHDKDPIRFMQERGFLL